MILHDRSWKNLEKVILGGTALKMVKCMQREIWKVLPNKSPNHMFVIQGELTSELQKIFSFIKDHDEPRMNPETIYC